MTQTFAQFRSRILATGMSEAFFQSVLLPEWWEEECETVPGVLFTAEVTAARFFRITIAAISDPERDLRAEVLDEFPTPLAYERAVVTRAWMEEEGFELTGKHLLFEGGVRLRSSDEDRDVRHHRSIWFDCKNDGSVDVRVWYYNALEYQGLLWTTSGQMSTEVADYIKSL